MAHLNHSITRGSAIREDFRQIDEPRLPLSRNLIELWRNRPADGFIIGRDIPTRQTARHLASILIWEPILNGEDFRLYLAGEDLRRRFGGNAIGQKFSELIDPAIVQYFLSGAKTLQTEDKCFCFDMRLTRLEPRNDDRRLHFELIVFPVWTSGRKARWLLNGVYYFP